MEFWNSLKRKTRGEGSAWRNVIWFMQHRDVVRSLWCRWKDTGGKKSRRRSHEYFSSVVRERTCEKLKNCQKKMKKTGSKRDVLMSKTSTPAALTPAGKLTPGCRKDTSPINNALGWSWKRIQTLTVLLICHRRLWQITLGGGHRVARYEINGGWHMSEWSRDPALISSKASCSSSGKSPLPWPYLFERQHAASLLKARLLYTVASIWRHPRLMTRQLRRALTPLKQRETSDWCRYAAVFIPYKR